MENVGMAGIVEINRDKVLDAIERAEKRVVASSFLVMKIVTIVVLVVAIILLEVGFLHQIWISEFSNRSSRPPSAAAELHR